MKLIGQMKKVIANIYIKFYKHINNDLKHNFIISTGNFKNFCKLFYTHAHTHKKMSKHTIAHHMHNTRYTQHMHMHACAHTHTHVTSLQSGVYHIRVVIT
jgi:threonine synthase